MNMNLKRIKDLVRRKKSFRGINLYKLKRERLQSISKICFDFIEYYTINHKAKPFYISWKRSEDLNVNQVQSRFRKINRYQRLIDQIIYLLNDLYPLNIIYTKRTGPEYLYDYYDSYDLIHMPLPYRFESSKLYYKTFAHELSHAACDSKRLNLEFKTYDEEEISVEATSMVLSALLGINTWEDSLSYISNRAYESNKLLIQNKFSWNRLNYKVQKLVVFFVKGYSRAGKIF